jgi:hypothetical protein
MTAADRIKDLIEVFLSYSRETDVHREWVRKLADRLEAEPDLHVVLDEYDLYGGKDLPHFMERSARSDRVVVVVTSRFAKADQREGGVGYETGIAAAELATSQNNNKFIPVSREGSGIPVFLRGKRYVDLHERRAQHPVSCRPGTEIDQGLLDATRTHHARVV